MELDMPDQYPAADYLPLPGANGVSYSQRLWSEEVAIAASMGGEPLVNDNRQPGYLFSNGTKFDSGPGATADNW